MRADQQPYHKSVQHFSFHTVSCLPRLLSDHHACKSPRSQIRKGFAGFFIIFIFVHNQQKSSFTASFGVMYLGFSNYLCWHFPYKAICLALHAQELNFCQGDNIFSGKDHNTNTLLFWCPRKGRSAPGLGSSLFPVEQHKCLTELQRMPIPTSASLSRRKCALFTNEAQNETQQ